MNAVASLIEASEPGTTPRAKHFGSESVATAAQGDIAAVAAGKLGALVMRNFFSVSECEAILHKLAEVELGSYDERIVTPRIAKLGPAAYDFYESGELSRRYWECATQSADSRATLLNGQDPLTVAVYRLWRIWNGPVHAATTGGRQLFAGMIREINNGARMHADEVVREFPGTLDDEPIVQLAFNCHLAMPPEGGEVFVYGRRWQPQDEYYRDGYGYNVDLVKGCPQTSVRPSVGDAVVFDPRNYHLVRPGRGGRRITLSFFAGISARGELLLWS